MVLANRTAAVCNTALCGAQATKQLLLCSSALHKGDDVTFFTAGHVAGMLSLSSHGYLCAASALSAWSDCAFGAFLLQCLALCQGWPFPVCTRAVTLVDGADDFFAKKIARVGCCRDP